VYDAYSALNIVHQKVTHTGRQNGRQLLEKAGVEKMSADVAVVVEHWSWRGLLWQWTVTAINEGHGWISS
jgi:hypothetical protein